MKEKRVAVTGVGMMSGLGNRALEHEEAMERGRPNFKPLGKLLVLKISVGMQGHNAVVALGKEPL